MSWARWSRVAGTACNLKLTSGIFHLMFSDYGLPWLTETMENKTANKEGQLYMPSLGSHLCTDSLSSLRVCGGKWYLKTKP